MTDLVNATTDQPSGWYVNTGEGTAVAAGSDVLEQVDLDSVLGDKFAVGLRAVADVNSRPELDDSQRFNEAQTVYSERLTAVAPRSVATNAGE